MSDDEKNSKPTKNKTLKAIESYLTGFAYLGGPDYSQEETSADKPQGDAMERTLEKINKAALKTLDSKSGGAVAHQRFKRVNMRHLENMASEKERGFEGNSGKLLASHQAVFKMSGFRRGRQTKPETDGCQVPLGTNKNYTLEIVKRKG